MAAPGEVLFCRGQDEEEASEIWDDTALIQAYDEAVKSVKAHLGEDVGGAGGGQDNTPGGRNHGNKQKRGKNKPKKNREKPKQQPKPQLSKWKVGDLCQAVYTEDGEIYQAMIREIDEEDGSCVVRFLGYGNEEVQELTDLLPSAVDMNKSYSSPGRLSQSGTDFSGNESGMEWSRASPTPHRGRGHRRGSQSRPGHAHQWPGPGGWPGMQGFPWGIPPPPQIPPLMGMMPSPPFTSMESPSWHAKASQSKPFIPDIPPPPPPDIDDSVGPSADKEALYSMLISWYMSGYHTGYYQGLKEGRKGTQNASAASVSSPQSESVASQEARR